MSKVDNLGSNPYSQYSKTQPGLKKTLPKDIKNPQELGSEQADKPSKSKFQADSDYTVDLSSRAKELEKSLKQEASKEAVKKAAEPEKVAAKKYGTVDQPGIFFISGFDWFGASSVKGDYDGITELAKAVDFGRHYTWDQKDQVLEEIKMLKTSQPIVLVGHSFGGDTAMEVAQELNTPEYKFRTVDLHVTLDSVGTDNDLVPQNVRYNLNYVADDSIFPFLNDGPKLALDYGQTKVENFLRKEKHSELDDQPDIQKRILEAIEQTVQNKIG